MTITYDTEDERIKAAMVVVAERVLPPSQLQAWVRVVVAGQSQTDVAAVMGVSPPAITKALWGQRSARGGLQSLASPRGGGAHARMADALSADVEFHQLIEELKAPQKQPARAVVDLVGWFSATPASSFVGRAVEAVIASVVDIRSTCTIDDLREQLDRTVLAEGLRQLRVAGVVVVTGQVVTYCPAPNKKENE